MTRILIVASIVVGLAASATLFRTPIVAAQDVGEILPGCQIPKSFGRLVNVLPGNNSGLAGQAVFEAEDGTIRWVPIVYNSTQTIQQKPVKNMMTPMFPIIPLHECMAGPIWKRH